MGPIDTNNPIQLFNFNGKIPPPTPTNLKEMNVDVMTHKMGGKFIMPYNNNNTANWSNDQAFEKIGDPRGQAILLPSLIASSNAPNHFHGGATFSSTYQQLHNSWSSSQFHVQPQPQQLMQPHLIEAQNKNQYWEGLSSVPSSPETNHNVNTLSPSSTSTSSPNYQQAFSNHAFDFDRELKRKSNLKASHQPLDFNQSMASPDQALTKRVKSSDAPYAGIQSFDSTTASQAPANTNATTNNNTTNTTNGDNFNSFNSKFIMNHSGFSLTPIRSLSETALHTLTSPALSSVSSPTSSVLSTSSPALRSVSPDTLQQPQHLGAIYSQLKNHAMSAPSSPDQSNHHHSSISALLLSASAPNSLPSTPVLSSSQYMNNQHSLSHSADHGAANGAAVCSCHASKHIKPSPLYDNKPTSPLPAPSSPNGQSALECEEFNVPLEFFDEWMETEGKISGVTYIKSGGKVIGAHADRKTLNLKAEYERPRNGLRKTKRELLWTQKYVCSRAGLPKKKASSDSDDQSKENSRKKLVSKKCGCQSRIVISVYADDRSLAVVRKIADHSAHMTPQQLDAIKHSYQKHFCLVHPQFGSDSNGNSLNSSGSSALQIAYASQQSTSALPTLSTAAAAASTSSSSSSYPFDSKRRLINK
eukprot:gene10918-12723_t